MTTKHWNWVAAISIAGLSLSATPALADVLSDVKSHGELVCGVLGGSKPFGYIDPSQGRDVVGYDVDMCRAIAKGLGVKPVVKQVTNDARIPELSQGRLDILVAALSWTPERAQQVDFTDQYFVAQLLVIAQKDSGIKSLADLKGKRVSVVKGSTSEVALKNRYPDAEVIAYQDPPSAFLAFQQGKTDAFSISALLMRRFLRDAGPAAADFVQLPQTLQTDPWGLGVRKGEKPFLSAVNGELEKMETNGEAKAIFSRWFNEKTGFPLERTFKIEPITSK